jgi:hypothetical protein
VCPYHKLGLLGLLLYFISLYYQPNLHNDSENLSFTKKISLFYKFLTDCNHAFNAEEKTAADLNAMFHATFFFFLACGVYTYSFLPYGRFYNRLGGNPGMLYAYLFFFSYLVFTFFRRPVISELYSVHV